MAFVSKDCIDQWFSTDNWVYKNFEYLFKNPLWDNRVPSGFSLCPYFWISMFSLLFFRPIVVPMCRSIGWAVKVILIIGGKPFQWWDELIGKLVKKDNYEKGNGILFTFLMILGLLMLYATGFLLYQVFLMLVKVGYEWISLVIWGIINFTALIATAVYISNNKYKNDRCKVEYYNVVLLIVSSGIIYFLHPTFILNGLEKTGIVLLIAVKSLYWLLGQACYCIWFGIKWTGIGLWITLRFIGIFLLILIPAVIAFSIFGAFGLLFMWIASKFEIKRNVKIDSKMKVEKEDWHWLIYNCFLNHSWVYGDLKQQIPRNERLSYLEGSVYFVRYKTIRKNIALDMIRNIIDHTKIPKLLLSLKYSEFKKIRSKVMSVKFKKRQMCGIDLINQTMIDCKFPKETIQELSIIRDSIRNRIFCGDVDDKNSSDYLFNKKFKKQYDKKLDDILKDREENRKIKSKRIEIKVKRKEQREKVCHFASDPIAALFIGIGKIIKFIAVKLIWNILICKPSKVVWFIIKNFGIFFVYMWTVIKHLKHGACPYRIFTNSGE